MSDRPIRKLARIPQKGWGDIFGGVLAGFAYYLGWSLWLVRLIFFVFAMKYGWLIMLYVLCLLFMDEYEEVPDDFDERTS
ncbi:MAG: PspC domain-containing protein [Parcubacteria group bacterium]|nr:PspC domain-containing protein [Parcubacteria group bacterium]